MRKIKVLSILLFIASIAIYILYGMHEKRTNDTVRPVLQCETNNLVVSVSATEEELLQGVTAMDDESGDVTDTIIIESISTSDENNSRVITYAAIDNKGNVGRIQRTLTYEDYQEPRFLLSGPLRFPIGKPVNVLEKIGAQSPLDGDLHDKIKYAIESVIDLKNTGIYDVEYRVMDSAGKVQYLPVKIEMYNPAEERINVVLTDYIVYFPKNSAFDANKYYVGSDIEGTLNIQSGVDAKTPGVYIVDYTVTGLNSIGKSQLIVVITES